MWQGERCHVPGEGERLQGLGAANRRLIAWLQEHRPQAAATIDAEIKMRERPVRFPSIDAQVHAEVMASPIRDVIDDRGFDALVQGPRESLADLCQSDGTIGFAEPAHVMNARKA